MNRWMSYLLLGVGLLTEACKPEKLSVEEVVQLADPAVVSIISYRQQQPLASGTGFIVDERGIVATNYHVIEDADALTVRLANGKTFTVLGVVDYNRRDNGYPDFALLKIDPDTTLPALPLGNPAKLMPGEQVVTIGDPRGFTHSVSTGAYSGSRVFRAESQHDSATYLQTTAPISPGNSGGPLLNLYGEVVGINTFHRADGQNLNFSLAITYIQDALAKNGYSVRFTLSEVLAQQQKRNQEQFEQLFSSYEHPDKLFSMLLPRRWQTHHEQFWRYNIDPDTSFVQSSVFAPPGAYNAETGYLAGGIRVMFYRPKAGLVWSGIRNRWATVFKRRMLATNDGFAFTPDSSAIQLDGVSAMMYRANGQNSNVQEIEVDRFIVTAQPNYLLTVELACPGSQLNDYDIYYKAILKSFRFGLPPGTAP